MKGNWWFIAMLLFVVTAPVFGEQVIPPADQGKMYLSIVGDRNDRAYYNLNGMFLNDKNLREFKKGVHFNNVTSDSAMYKARYQENVKGLPTVRLQNAKGIVLYEAYGSNLPTTAMGMYIRLELASILNDNANWQYATWGERFGNCPWGKCRPKQEQEEEPVEKLPEPKSDPVVEPEPDGPNILLLVVLGLVAGVVGLGAGVLSQLRKEHTERS